MVGRIGPTGRGRNLDRPRHAGSRGAQGRHEVVEIEFTFARCPTVLETIAVVVVTLGDSGSVVQLHTGHQFARQIGDGRQIT